MIMNVMTIKGFFYTTFKKYFNFKGRASRAEFIWWHIYLIVISLLLGMALSNFLTNKQFEAFSSIYGLLMLIPNISLTVRRLHDSSNSGWLLLICFVLWFLLAVIGNIFFAYLLSTVISYISIVPIIYLYYLILFKAGDNESNKYGILDNDYKN